MSGPHEALESDLGDDRRALTLRLVASESSFHRVVSDLTKKHVVIEWLRFESGRDAHWLCVVVRAPASRLDHATAVLRNDAVVTDLKVDPPGTAYLLG